MDDNKEKYQKDILVNPAYEILFGGLKNENVHKKKKKKLNQKKKKNLL